jgi:hypothetical protein
MAIDKNTKEVRDMNLFEVDIARHCLKMTSQDYIQVQFFPVVCAYSALKTIIILPFY